MEGLDTTGDDGSCYDGLSGGHGAVKALGDRSSAERWVRLARTIEGEVIPRLMLCSRPEPVALPAVNAAGFDGHTPERLAFLALNGHDDETLAFVHALLVDGLPLETVYLDLLAPAARILGRQWEADEIGFTDVTIALSKLQRLMRRLSSVVGTEPVGARPVRAAVLLAAVPGDQHLFGVLMLEEFFRRDGWAVDVLPRADREDIVDAVRAGAYAVVGLSMTVDDLKGDLQSLISEIRDVARDHPPIVMVGGRCFNDNPGLLAEVGGDFTAVDGREAIRHIQDLLTDGPQI